jgi:predicted O-methyltransferase YrrM
MGYWVRRPHKVWARLSYWLWEKRNPDAPWIMPGAVEFCRRALTGQMRALEFGSGRSTAWFARRVGHLTSVEHSPAWYEQVRARLARDELRNVDYWLVPLDHPAAQPEQDAYDPLPAYVSVLRGFAEESLDFIVVDGHYRTACIRNALDKLKPGGLLLVDDVNMWGAPELLPVPAEWPLVHRSGNGLKLTCVWKKPARDGA